MYRYMQFFPRSPLYSPSDPPAAKRISNLLTSQKSMARWTARRIAIVILLLALVLVPSWLILTYNGLVAGQQEVKAEWAQVENQLQRKVDLIPALVEVAQDYAEFEQSTLENITALRTQWLAADSVEQQIEVAEQMDQIYVDVLAVVENYPILQTVTLFLSLMDELAGTENRIAVERMRYNEAVQGFNTRIKSFPANLVAGPFGFQEAAYYDPIPGGPSG